MIELLKSFNLAIQHALFWLTLDGTDVDHLYCYFFSCPVIHTTVDYRTETSPYDVFESIGVVLDFFTQIVVAVLRI